MQEQQHVPVRMHRPGVHLERPTARAGQNPARQGRSQLLRPIPTAAIDHDDLVALGTQRAQGFERGDDAVRFVEDGDDDAEFHGVAFMRQS